jgi:hypothetical protein
MKSFFDIAPYSETNSNPNQRVQKVLDELEFAGLVLLSALLFIGWLLVLGSFLIFD